VTREAPRVEQRRTEPSPSELLAQHRQLLRLAQQLQRLRLLLPQGGRDQLRPAPPRPRTPRPPPRQAPPRTAQHPPPPPQRITGSRVRVIGRGVQIQVRQRLPP